MLKKIYFNRKAMGWKLFKCKLRNLLTRYKLVDTRYYNIISRKSKFFILSENQSKKSEEIYRREGTISYEFYPCSGIGWGVRIHNLDTKKVIDITDVSIW